MSAKQFQPILAEALKNNWSVEKVMDRLIADGHDQVSADLMLREYKKLKNSARQTKGFVLMAIGSVIGFLSCVFTVFNVFPESTNLVLYGLTTVAICLAVWGLYFVFE